MNIPDKGIRIINFTIDLLAIAVAYSVISNLIIVSINPNIIMYVCMFFYYLIFESINGRTIGKIITDTKVVDSKHTKPGFLRILLRTVLRFNPFDVMSYLLGTEVGAHDKISRTMVVKSNK
ncbi:RDD family protein [Carboxylicivirga sp. RSCT41]|uniref:RDD family protein n=1 Tax=Carboxylicivirga agarovorans TaxID=3417570 RepID=UPI003D354B2F